MNSFSDTFVLYINPLLGAVALGFVIAFLFYLIRLVNKTTDTLDKTHKTIDLVDTSIEKIQAPLETVEKVSKTVDKAHDVTVGAINSAKDFITKSAESIKNSMTSEEDEEDDEDDK